MEYFLAILVGSQMDIAIWYMAFILYVVVQKILNRDSGLSLLQWQYLGILALGAVTAFLYMFFNAEAHADMSNIVLNIRKYMIEILFAIALYDYLKQKDLEFVLRIIYISVIVNIGFGTYQLITLYPERILMLFSEPSSAGYYYLFVFFIIYEKFKSTKFEFLTSRYFMLLGLAIGSKSQIILLALVVVLRYATPLKLLTLFSLTGIIIYIFKEQLMGIEAIEYNLMVLNLYWEDGLASLRIDNGVWGTYVTRISAIQGAIICIFDYPLGIGFGGFNSWYVENMRNIGFESIETDLIINGDLYATPKSNLLNFFVSTGFAGIALYAYWFREFFRIRKEKLYLFQSFILLTFASLFIELNPMFIYIIFLFVLKDKESELIGNKN